MRDPLKLYIHDRIIGVLFDPIIPGWVTPNHITRFRFLMTPVVVFLLAMDWYSVGVPLFLFVAFTDVLDGSLARLRNQVTAWGTLYDPLADKLLIGSVLIIILFRYVDIRLASLLVALDLVAIIAGIVRTRRGEVVMANRWGKGKMFLQVVGVALLLTGLWFNVQHFVPYSTASLTLAVIFAVISLLSYGI